MTKQMDSAPAMLLGREAILGIADTQIADVEVPEWGGTVRVRGLTGTDRDAFEGEIAQRKGKSVQMNTRNIRARLVQLSVVDADGNRLFSHLDVEALGQKSAKALDRVFSTAMELSGLSDKDVEDMTENLEPGQSGASTSA